MAEKFTPLVTPDSARKVFQLMNRFFDGYTKKNCGHEDIDGLQYAGTVNNFGSEIYFESRKMRMDKPPIKSLLTHNDFNFYFNILYSELIETYDQQSMLVATLKDNVLLTNKKYSIIFSDCTKRNILRAESWGDPVVKKDEFIVTDTPPVLRITNEDDTYTDITLDASCTFPIEYCFHLNKTNYRLYEYDEDAHTLTVKERAADTLTYREVNQPLVWLHCTSFDVIPDIGFFNNVDQYGNPLLVIGTDGHGVSRVYPKTYYDNYPPYDPLDGLKWFIKVKSTDTTSFREGYAPLNESAVISTIEYMRANNPWEEPTSSVIIVYDNEVANMFLNPGETDSWSYHTPEEGDYDYDGTTFINRTYAYKCIDDATTEPTTDLIPFFLLKFELDKMNDFNGYFGNAVTGIHLETCSDYSDNGVLKKNGFIHSLGDFDGLPKYFKTLEDKTQHRSHVELYAINEVSNKLNQKATDKQTAAIIVDSSLPHKDSEEYNNDMDVLIKYDFNYDGIFYTEDQALDMKDVKTAMTYVDDETFAEEHLPGRANAPHFIYHGDGIFSLTSSSLNPELEYGRVFVISNDASSYENNAKTNNPKPARTFARICDIPTTFSQLIHVTGIAPTIIIDEDYIHQDASFNEDEQERLINGLQSRWCTDAHQIDGKGTFMGFFTDGQNLDMHLPVRSYTPYTRKVNLNPTVFFSDFGIGITNPGHGYAVDDKFTFYLGGILVTGTITDVFDGGAYTVELDVPDSQRINVANLDDQLTYFKTETISGVGEGLEILLTVEQSVWDEVTTHTSNVALDGLFTLKFDKYGFLWFWEWNPDTNHWEQRSQFVGPEITDNKYDFRYDMNKRETGDVMLYNILTRHRLGYYPSMNEYSEQSEVSVSTPIEQVETFTYPNYPSSYYILDNYPSEYGPVGYYRLTYYTDQRVVDEKSYTLFPRYNELNLSKTRNKGTSLEIMSSDTQPLFGYFNPVKDTVTTWDKVTSTRYDVHEKPMTVLDVITDEYITTTGYMKAPLFKYNEFTTSPEFNHVVNTINMMNRGALITYIRNVFPNAILLQYEGTENEYTEEMLRNYILSNCYDTPVYYKQDIQRIKRIDEQAVIFDGDEIIPVGEQPTGGYEYLVDKHHPGIIMNDTNYISEITNIFKLNQEIDLTGFRIIDDNNNDVSRNSLIIMNREKYVFVDEWVKID